MSAAHADRSTESLEAGTELAYLASLCWNVSRLHHLLVDVLTEVEVTLQAARGHLDAITDFVLTPPLETSADAPRPTAEAGAGR